MKKYFLFSLLLPHIICGQNITFQKVFGGYDQEFALSARQFSDESYAILGRTESFGAGGIDIFLLKLDKFGNVLWAKTYGGTKDEQPSSFILTNNGGFIICGVTSSFGTNNYELFAMKLDSIGNVLLEKKFSGDSTISYGVSCQTKDGGFVFAGTTKNNLNKTEIVFFKTDSQFNVQYATTFRDSLDLSPSTVIETIYREYLIGFTKGYYSIDNTSLGLLKIDSTGNFLWSRIYDTPADDICGSIIMTPDSGFLIPNNTLSYGSQIIKVNIVGDTLWTKNKDIGMDYGIQVENNGNGFLISGTGNTSLGWGNPDGMVLKVTSTGNINWGKVYYSDVDNVFIRAAIPTYDSGFLTVGGTFDRLFYPSQWSSNDIIIIKTDSIGNSGCFESPYLYQGIQQLQLTVSNNLLNSGSINISFSPISSMSTAGQNQKTLCSSLGIADQDFIHSIQIFPNPSSDFISISYKPQTKNPQFEIIDVMGRKIFSFKFPLSASQKQIDISKLPQGVYLLKVTDGDMYSVKRFVKK